MRVLSLFDGISCARAAFGNRPCVYMASEIDPQAISIAQKNYPTTQQLGDVSGVGGLTDIDLLIGGSPCTDLSIAHNARAGLDGERSRLFWEYVRIKNECKPKWFILENVASMTTANKDRISAALGVQPILIDAALVSAQMRKRLFWTNIPVLGLPADRNLTLKDILQPAASVSDKYETSMRTARVFKALKGPDDKARCLTATCYKGSNANGMTNIRVGADGVRRLTPIECERLQGLPDGYTASISDKARYRVLGNGFNVEVIKFIIGFIPAA